MKRAFWLLILLFGLVGLGQAQTPHSVGLTWTTSTSTCVINTNVHRSTTSGGTAIGTNFAVVADTGHGVAGGYTDTNVVAGTTYYYTISSWGTTCGGTTHESVLSAEFKAVVPPDCTLPSTIINGVCTAPPLPPGNFTGKVN